MTGSYVINFTWPQIELSGCKSTFYKVCLPFVVHLHLQCLYNLNQVTPIEYGSAAFEWE